MAFEQKDVRVGHSLNDAETHYVNSRKKSVQDALRRLGVICTEDEVPTIAVMSSGAGLTGMFGLLGSVWELQKGDLLDAIMYLSGTSGSTWGMASLYEEPNWSKNLNNIIEKMITRLIYGNITFEMQFEKLKKYFQEENFSLTHIWAVFLSKIIKQIDEHVLTEQRNKHDADPYPIFNVIDKQCADKKQFKDTLFEITPDESGYSLGGVFVDTAFLGSEYDNGTRTKRCLEEDMLYLQGLCTSANPDPSDLFELISNLLELKSGVNAEEKKQFDLIKALVDLNQSPSNEKDNHFRVIKNIIQDEKYAASGLQDIIQKFENPMNEENIREFIILVLELLWDLVWIHAEARMIIRILVLLFFWTWGTTNNIVHNLSVPDIDPSVSSTNTREYEDAALLPFISLLSLCRKERKVDIIIFFDFSGGNSIENVRKTAELSKGINVPFPEVPSDDGSEVKDFYVYNSDSAAPVVIHIPLFNSVNCKGEIKKWEEQYSSTKLFKDRNMITALMEKSASNISNNKEKLLNEIKLIVKQKKQK